jgi:hypothetical protein
MKEKNKKHPDMEQLVDALNLFENPKFVGDENFDRVITRIRGPRKSPYMKSKYKDTYPFIRDIDQFALKDGGSSIFPCVQFALYTGATHLYIIGCDCYYPFSQMFQTQRKKFDVVKKYLYSWKMFKLFAEKEYPNTKITVVNPLGLTHFFDDHIYT